MTLATSQSFKQVLDKFLKIADNMASDPATQSTWTVVGDVVNFWTAPLTVPAFDRPVETKVITTFSACSKNFVMRQ